jgi:hypothetical protein
MGNNFYTKWIDSTTKYKLADMDPPLASLDQAISYLKNIIVHCDGDIIWMPYISTLGWNGTIRILFVRSDGQATQNTIAVGSLVVNDNEFAYVDLNETNGTALTMQKAAVSAGSASNFKAHNRIVLGYRNAVSDNFYPVALRQPWPNTPGS